jgi:hypothetical protein
VLGENDKNSKERKEKNFYAGLPHLLVVWISHPTESVKPRKRKLEVGGIRLEIKNVN